jgi:hypothetical protein
MLERAKTVHALDHAATVIGYRFLLQENMKKRKIFIIREDFGFLKN